MKKKSTIKKPPLIYAFALFCLKCKSSKTNVHGMGDRFLLKCYDCGNQYLTEPTQPDMPTNEEHALTIKRGIQN